MGHLNVAVSYAYIASGQLHIIDIADSQHPILKADYETLDSAKEVALMDDFVYVADNKGGLLILRYPRDFTNCTPLENRTSRFVEVWGYTNPAQVAPAGATITAHRPDGTQVGCYQVTTAGRYGLMRVYGEDENSPNIPGLREGETPAFQISGVPVHAESRDNWDLVWRFQRDNGQAYHVDLATKQVNLTIAKDAQVDMISAGSLLTYTLTITNTSDILASGTMVTDSLPSIVQYMWADPAPQSQMDDTVVWQLGEMAPGQVGKIQLTVKVPETNAPEIINEAWVSCEEEDLDPADNYAKVSVQVSVTCQRYDLNEDGFIDISDINIEIAHSIFYNAPYNPEYDFNQDGLIDIVDIFVVANHFGETCVL